VVERPIAQKESKSAANGNLQPSCEQQTETPKKIKAKIQAN